MSSRLPTTHSAIVIMGPTKSLSKSLRTIHGFDAKVVTRFGVTQVELRKTFRGHSNATQMLIIVSLGGGYFSDYEYHGSRPDRWGRSTKGTQVRLSSNRAAELSLEEFGTINSAVEAAFQYLTDLEDIERTRR